MWWVSMIPTPEGKFKMNLLGEYNIGGDAFELEDFRKMPASSGRYIQRQFNLWINFANSHTADLNMSCAIGPSTMWQK